eukprot:jgi/Mesen1/8083/ME000434S07328
MATLCYGAATSTVLALGKLPGCLGRDKAQSLSCIKGVANNKSLVSFQPHRFQQRSRGQLLQVRAIEVSGPGAVNSPLMQDMHEKIKQQLEAESVEIKDAYGDGRHVSITVVSPLFEGKRSLDRQRMVYKAIWEELQGTVHAVDTLVTKAPSEVV